MDNNLLEVVKRLYALVQRQGALIGALTSQLTRQQVVSGQQLKADEQEVQALLQQINSLAAMPDGNKEELQTLLDKLDKYVYGA